MKRCLSIALAAVSLVSPMALAQPASVTLPAADQERLGVSTATLAAREIPQTIAALAHVLDIGPLAALDAEIAATRAASRASALNAERLEHLAAQDQAASQQALEAAQAQAAADAARRDLAERRVRLEWGSGLADMTLEARVALVSDIAAGTAALLRVNSPDRDVGAATGIALVHSSAASPVAARVLGPTVSVDPRLQSLGLLALVRGEAAQVLRPGRVLTAEIDTGERATGVLVPRGALVRIDGATWAYVKTGPNLFERRELAAAWITADGWLVSNTIAAGDEVVDHGAGSLLAVERGVTADEDD